MSGGVRKTFGRAEEDAVDGTVVEMPAEERHEDLFGREGARIIVLETASDPGTLRCFRDWRARALADCISRELARPDAFTPLALEGLALELGARVGRQREIGRREPRLDAVHDILGAEFSSPPSLSQVAHELGLHPSHLARIFRARYGESIGEHSRRLRLEWSAHLLTSSDETLVSIAERAGFADQSHFTRAFKARFGLTPGRYRLAHR